MTISRPFAQRLASGCRPYGMLQLLPYCLLDLTALTFPIELHSRRQYFFRKTTLAAVGRIDSFSGNLELDQAIVLSVANQNRPALTEKGSVWLVDDS